MERNTITKVNRLNYGDRFYKVKDKKKKVFELIPGERKTTAFRSYGFFGKADDELHPRPLDGKTDVVFLRHNEAANYSDIPNKFKHRKVAYFK